MRRSRWWPATGPASKPTPPARCGASASPTRVQSEPMLDDPGVRPSCTASTRRSTPTPPTGRLRSPPQTTIRWIPDAATRAAAASMGRVELLSLDFDGDSLAARAADAHGGRRCRRSFDWILQEPPQHLDYFPNGGLVNVSRTPAFNVGYTDARAKAFAVGGGASSDWNVGTSVKANATFGVDGDFLIAKANLSASVTNQFNYDYEQQPEATTSAPPISTPPPSRPRPPAATRCASAPRSSISGAIPPTARPRPPRPAVQPTTSCRCRARTTRPTRIWTTWPRRPTATSRSTKTATC